MSARAVQEKEITDAFKGCVRGLLRSLSGLGHRAESVRTWARASEGSRVA